jgi:DNA-binding response OmpR family regulator
MAMPSSVDRVPSSAQPLVLVADDHEDTRIMLRELLTMDGFIVIECEDGAKALAEARRTMPDLVLLDGRLPDLDGLDVARALRSCAEGNGVPIVFVSGDDLSTSQAIAAGCDRALLKPVDPLNLLAIVRHLARATPRSTAKARQQDGEDHGAGNS